MALRVSVLHHPLSDERRSERVDQGREVPEGGGVFFGRVAQRLNLEFNTRERRQVIPARLSGRAVVKWNRNPGRSATTTCSFGNDASAGRSGFGRTTAMFSDRPEDEARVRTAAQFATTHWSVVLAAGESASPDSKEALEKLCRQYWYPLYAFVRRQGRSPEDAEDLIQGFLLYLIERQVIDKARPELGRFRSFLLGCLKNYLAQQQDISRAQKRGGDQQFIPLHTAEAERRLKTETDRETTPDALFDQKWGVVVLAHALKAVEADYSRSGQAKVFQWLHPFLQGDSERLGYHEASEGLGITEPAVRMAVTRLRRRYRAALRQAVAETVSDPKEIDDELRYLIQIQAE